ncbi:MAG: aldo/keto reductase, partial [Acidobacteriota bacterium]
NQFDILRGEDPSRKGVLRHCAQNKLSFIAWSPLRGGLLSERYLDRSKAKPGDRLVDEKKLDKELTSAVHKKLKRLAALARDWGLTLTQLTIAAMLHLPGMGPVIAGCSTPSQVAENAKAGKVKLRKDQMTTLSELLGTF